MTDLCKLGLRTVFRLHNTLRQRLVQVKTHIPEEYRKGVVYEVPCTDWKRRILEALFIQKQRPTMNLDCGLQINQTWKPTISSNVDQ